MPKISMKRVLIICVLLIFSINPSIASSTEARGSISLDSITISQPTSSTTWDASDLTPKSISWSYTTNGVNVYLYKGKSGNSRMVQSFGYAREGATGMKVVLSTALAAGNDYYIFIEEWFGNYETGTSDYFTITNSGGGDSDDGSITNNPSTTTLEISGNTIYMADQIDDLLIYDVKNPSDPTLVKKMDITGEIADISVSGNTLYLGITQPAGSYDTFYGLAMLDITDPQNPGEPTYVNTKGKVFGMFIAGGYAFLTTPGGYDTEGNWQALHSLIVIDIEDPANPGAPIYKELDPYLSGVWVEGQYAYVIVSEKGIAILNIDDPTQPGDPSYISVNGMGEDLFIDDQNRLFYTSSDGIQVVDVSDPANPGVAQKTGLDEGLPKVYGDFMLSKKSQALNMYDISDLASPQLITTKYAAGLVFDHELVGEYLFIADYGGGLKTFYIGEDLTPDVDSTGENGESSEGLSLDFPFIGAEFLVFILSTWITTRYRRRK